MPQARPCWGWEGKGPWKGNVVVGGGGDGDGDDAPLLSAAELDAAGRALIGTLLSTRHSGAIEKAAAGLGMLADRLLGCGLPERAALPRAWCAALLR